MGNPAVAPPPPAAVPAPPKPEPQVPAPPNTSRSGTSLGPALIPPRPKPEPCEAELLLAEVTPKRQRGPETAETKARRLQREIDDFALKCRLDYQYFAGACLKIKTKTQGIQPLVFNRGQQYLHEVAEKMLELYGMVRIVIVKGRQQGLSTWVEGRGYWKTSQFEGINAYILAHEDKSTKNLFNMAKRFHEHCPAELKPLAKKSNAKELVFHELESEYAVGTAKVGDSGRGNTIHFFHGSECAYWRAAEDISSGAMQGIPEEPGTEIYMESTAAGAGGFFHGLWQKGCFAEDADNLPDHWNGYWRVFIPWFWEDAYRRDPIDGFVASDEEKKIAQLYDLDIKQLAWRRHKIATMKGDVSRFQRDYPANPGEAFNSSLSNVLVRPEVVMTAMMAGREEMYMPVGRSILGVDVAREGDDDTTLVLRQGRVIKWYKRLSKLKTLEVAGEIVNACRQHPIDHICIDATGGYGAGVYDVLVGYGYGNRTTPVGFAERAIDDERYKNRRTEMYWLFKEWLEAGASIPDKDEWLTELCAITYKHEPTTDKLMLERKDEIRKRIGKSTDIGDGAALTFCMPAIMMQDGRDSFDPQDEYGVI